MAVRLQHFAALGCLLSWHCAVTAFFRSDILLIRKERSSQCSKPHTSVCVTDRISSSFLGRDSHDTPTFSFQFSVQAIFSRAASPTFRIQLCMASQALNKSDRFLGACFSAAVNMILHVWFRCCATHHQHAIIEVSEDELWCCRLTPHRPFQNDQPSNCQA